MSQPFLGEIKIFSFNFAPRGWTMCNGQLLPINQNQPLFSLLGTTYGGDGQVNFALPDYRGRVPIHMNPAYSWGARGGEQAHTLLISEMPTHTHLMGVSTAPVTATGANQTPGPTKTLAPAIASKQGGGTQNVNIYGSAPPNTTMAANSTTTVGGSQAHQNMQPFLTLTFCIALSGIFPSRT